jgi:hypothetical protein
VTGELRQRLRVEIDAARRARIDWSAEPRCRGCGIEIADAWSGDPLYTTGCRCCSERRATRAKRERTGEVLLAEEAA